MDYSKIVKRTTSDTVPSPMECLQLLLTKCKPQDLLFTHSLCVAKLALIIGIELRNVSYTVDCNLLVAGGLLHDIAKGEPDHDKKGERIVRALGFLRVAELVGNHKDISLINTQELTEEEIVYLSDKMIYKNMIIDLQKRFKEKSNKYGTNTTVKAIIDNRLTNALRIKGKVENKTHKEFQNILTHYHRIDNDYIFAKTL